MSLKFGWYGDDFTGATDTLAVAARSNLRSILFLDVPTQKQLSRVGPLEAIGIAGTARSMSGLQMQASLPRVGRFFQEMAVPVLHYKCCSTFDSAPNAGSLGEAIRILGQYVGAPCALIVGGQPDIGRYCCFGNLFASAGSSSDIYRIDRHPTMQCHPVTPMDEADLRLHLKCQGMQDVFSVPYTAYRQQPAALDEQVDRASDHGRSDMGKMGRAVLFDVSDNAQLTHIGRQIQRLAKRYNTALVVGSSVVLQAVAAHWGDDQNHDASEISLPEASTRKKAGGPTFVLAASLSPVTAAQVATCHSYEKIALQARTLLVDAAYRQAQCRKICDLLAKKRHVLAYVDQQNGRDPGIDSGDLAQGTAQFVRDVMHGLAERGIRLGHLGIAGGDTSSQAVARLNVWALSYSRILSPGVTVCTMHSDDVMLDGLEVMLKGGQMGTEDVFERLLLRPED
ncbi:Hrp-dependent type III effector protein [Advenella kashmirensis W13003]|uniref:Hrp-dependent type III effector protein n=1 Tax=Advenella kashmirensis W13003 TaxID=1424334 RepID=V8QTU2_9BURK|nr:four-carbon acid sugar kinase family protein [Advenella kashmirensis]ETF03366.1 Hrp-dependent type III effector protein [Advenella kashmirensis W13003]